MSRRRCVCGFGGDCRCVGGLINDNHDTWNGFYHPVGSGTQAPVVTQPDCSAACHVTGGTPAVASKIGHDIIDDTVLMPSINYIFDQLVKLGHMPPTDPESDYRWINRDDPGFSGDHEDLADIQREYPPMTCSNPNYLEAHVVDSPEIITTNLPDKFNRFNLQDGLVCLSGEQSDGHRRRDYQTRYMCGTKFTTFRSLDDPSGSGDWEPRNSYKKKYGLCDNPTWIQARFLDRGNWVYINGPADRLAQFDSNGLVCLNADQDNRKCSNYVVRFSCP
jgi:Mucin-2 protein WxxW repeating region